MKSQLPTNPPKMVFNWPPAKNGFKYCNNENTITEETLAINADKVVFKTALIWQKNNE